MEPHGKEYIRSSAVLDEYGISQKVWVTIRNITRFAPTRSLGELYFTSEQVKLIEGLSDLRNLMNGEMIKYKITYYHLAQLIASNATIFSPIVLEDGAVIPTKRIFQILDDINSLEPDWDRIES